MKKKSKKSSNTSDETTVTKKSRIEELRNNITKISQTRRKRLAMNELRQLVKKEKSIKRRKRREAEKRGIIVERQTPRSIDTMRKPGLPEQIENVGAVGANDEFASHFSGEITPKNMITTFKQPSKFTQRFLKELLYIIPNSFYYKRDNHTLGYMVDFAKRKNFTNIIVFAEHLRKPYGMYLCHLPDGPSSFFRLTNLKLASDIKGGASLTLHFPELALNNFTTTLGQRIGRQIACLFPQIPEFPGRRIFCFHNQRDFIFVRHHRYINFIQIICLRYMFNEEQDRCYLQEIGPRFTLKLRWLKKGAFELKNPEYEFKWKPDYQVDRKVMFI